MGASELSLGVVDPLVLVLMNAIEAIGEGGRTSTRVVGVARLPRWAQQKASNEIDEQLFRYSK